MDSKNLIYKIIDTLSKRDKNKNLMSFLMIIQINNKISKQNHLQKLNTLTRLKNIQKYQIIQFEESIKLTDKMIKNSN